MDKAFDKFCHNTSRSTGYLRQTKVVLNAHFVRERDPCVLTPLTQSNSHVPCIVSCSEGKLDLKRSNSPELSCVRRSNYEFIVYKDALLSCDTVEPNVLFSEEINTLHSIM